ncbi:MAG: 50S ribosomal protein L23 [Chloroflexi bacterium]|nr:50S ribosomal protein L23 [Chloroflexota bacterium]
MHPYEVLRRPLVTEKVTRQGSQNQYAFEVALNANKVQIKEAVEMAFKVKVVAVNTSRVHGKERRLGRTKGFTPDWKKAVVTLQEGQKIEVFEGV